MDKAILSVSPAPLAAVEISPRPRPAAADMGMVMRAARMAMTAEPVFASAEEPVADGRSYRALDGQSYARPDLRLGERQGSLPGPDVMFLRELDGATYLHIGLVQSLPEGALPLGSPVGPPGRAAPHRLERRQPAPARTDTRRWRRLAHPGAADPR